MQLTKGGVYLLKKCETQSKYEDEEIYVQIIATNRIMENNQRKYLKCTCIDGTDQETNIYVELNTNSNYQLPQKNDIIMIKSFINEKNPKGDVIILVMSYNPVKAKIQTKEIKEQIAIQNNDKMSTELIHKAQQIHKNNKMDYEKENSIDVEVIQEKSFQFYNMNNAQITHYQNQQMISDKRNHSVQNNPKMNDEIVMKQSNIHSRQISSTNNFKQQPKFNKGLVNEVINIEEDYSNNNQVNYFGSKSVGGTLSDKLNKQTLLVSELKVGIGRFSFKFEGFVQTKSDIKLAKDRSKHFFIKVLDSMNQEINISFWINTEEFFNQIQIGQTYYFFGGEINKFNEKIELKFKKSDCEIIAKDQISNNMNPLVQKIPSVDQITRKESESSSLKTRDDQYSVQAFQKSSNFVSNNNKNQKKLMTVLDFIQKQPKYITIKAQISDFVAFDKNIKLKIQDKSCDNEINVVIFPDLCYEWQDKMEKGKYYIFKEFVNQEYNGDIQLKNNKFSKIEESEKQTDSDSSQENIQIQKTTSIIETRTTKQISETNPHYLYKQSSNMNNMIDFNKTATINEVIEQAHISDIGQKKEFVVYGSLVSIQMKNKLYYYKCQCSLKATLKYQSDSSYFCESCQNFINPQIQLMLRGFIQDASGTIQVILFDQIACFLINLLDPNIKYQDAGLFVKNCIENGQEEVLRQVLSKLDHMRFKFEVFFENKEFNNEQEIIYKVSKIQKENCREESRYLLKKIEQYLKKDENQE